MMGHLTECAICGATLPPLTEGYLCAEHEAWHNGWFHVPKMEQLRLDVWNNHRSDWYFGVHSHLVMMRESDRISGATLQKVRFPLWVVLMDIDRRARLWLDGGDQGWGDAA